MNTKLIVFILAISFYLPVWAQKDVHLFAVNFAKNNKAGYIDSTGKVIIPYIFDEVLEFSDGLAVVRVSDKYGYIDKTGNFVIPAQFDFAYMYKNDVAKVYTNGKNMFVDKQGNVFSIPNITYDNFYNGMIKILDNKKYGFANNTGKIVVPATYDEVSYFEEDIAYGRNDKTYYFFDKTGKILFKTNNEPIGYFSEGLVQVKIGEKFGYMNKSGKIVIPANFQYRNNSYSPFSDGLAIIQEGDYYNYKMGAIDKTGKIVIKPDFDYISNFKNGYASFSSDSKLGYINKTGKIIVPAQYANAFEFSEGIAIAIRSLENYKYQYELINTNGKIINTFEAYEGIREETKFVHGLCRLQQTIEPSQDLKDENMRQWGGVKTIMVNTKGEIVWESEPWYSCFPANAQVLMSDFSEKTISEIKVGDEILTYNQQSGKTENTIVTEVQILSGTFYIIDLLTSDNYVFSASLENKNIKNNLFLEITPNHPVLTDTGMVAAKNLKVGNFIYSYNTTTNFVEKIKVIQVTKKLQTENRVYNLKTKTGNYIVNNIVVGRK